MRAVVSSSRARLYVVLVACGVTCYLGAGAMFGDRGILAMLRLRQELRRYERDLSEVIRLREELKRRNALLHEDTLNLDLLDERSRSVLGHAEPDEFVVILKPQ
ncbi:FtsB family cell division protein [Anaplasma capra]|uniref:FtsB family cell division protein n=1 Tax=Anaplasma capra TaxID=1562740 RepID=UPI0021D59C3F|nr:septum formation initiator [Anaplasma capra]MCU7611657.1 septum formation initiator [Anaplasma capra]MCU7612194.1 septum formation initiator [Anaplasma capra]